MKKLKLVGASILILFLVFYNYPVITSDPCLNLDTDAHGDLEVIKEVYFDGSWTESDDLEAITPDLGETLKFRITMTYHNTSGIPKKHWAYNVKVNDTLPPCLDYEIDTADPTNNFTWIDEYPNEYLNWDFGDQPIYEEESLIINYNATVVEPTDEDGQENNVTVYWYEHCTLYQDGKSSDTLTMIVSSEPKLKLEKKVWDPTTHQYVKSITTYSGETLKFRIDVHNLGSDDLTGVLLNDTYPDFLTPLDYSELPLDIVTIACYIVWDLGTIEAYNSKVILFNATVNNVAMKRSGKNFANVTCDQDLNDSDNVTIFVDKHIVVDKKVKHPDTGEWVEEIPYVKGCEPVRFRINITYFGIERMKCLLIYDQLPPDCLEYADNVYIEIAGVEITPSDENYYPEIFTGNDTFIKCGEIVEIPEGGIFFSWINQSLGSAGALENGDSVIIEFDSSVIEYCECEGKDCCKKENCVEAWLWSCCEDIYYAMDCVDIYCIPLPGDFNKTVSSLEPINWVKELNTVQGMTIKFKLELIYYGNENLTNVTFYDILPCCLEYESTETKPQGTVIEVSQDKKMIWWNITKEIADCETVTIIFRAKVTGSSECGGCINHAYAYGYIFRQCEGYEQVVDRYSNAIIYAEANSPPDRPDVSGPSKGVVGVQNTFKAMLTDPDGNQVTYKFNWGDGQETDWKGPVSPQEVTEQHTYSTAGTFFVKAKVKDEYGEESDWTQYPWEILIQKAEVEVTLSPFTIGAVEATVKNTGDADLSNVAWEFNISRDALLAFRDINIETSGTISNLLAGASETIESDSVGFRFGFADVTVTVSKTGVLTPATATGRAFLIGPIVIILPS